MVNIRSGRLLRLKYQRIQLLKALKTEIPTLIGKEVQFRDIDHAEARHYWQSGEPVDKAGSYGIQGLGALFVERLSGSYSGVVGLPVFETAALLRDARIPFPGLRSADQ